MMAWSVFSCRKVETVQLALLPGSRLETAVMTHRPSPVAVTRPFSSTVAMRSSEELQVTLRSAAYQGQTVASRLAPLLSTTRIVEAEGQLLIQIQIPGRQTGHPLIGMELGSTASMLSASISSREAI